MTDFERWKAFLSSFSIVFDIEPNPTDCVDGEFNIVITAGEQKDVQGYFGMSFHVTFDRDGKFLNVGVWE